MDAQQNTTSPKTMDSSEAEGCARSFSKKIIERRLRDPNREMTPEYLESLLCGGIPIEFKNDIEGGIPAKQMHILVGEAPAREEALLVADDISDSLRLPDPVYFDEDAVESVPGAFHAGAVKRIGNNRAHMSKGLAKRRAKIAKASRRANR